MVGRRTYKHVAVVAILLASIALRARAAEPDASCAADARRFCSGGAHDRAHMRHCLIAHSAELSPQCKLRLQAAADRGQRRRACQPDIQKFCKDTGHGRGHFLKCLEAHEAQLSPACKQALTDRQHAAQRTPRSAVRPTATPHPTAPPH